MGAHDGVAPGVNGGAVARPAPPAVLDIGGLVVYGQIFDAWFDVVFDAVARRVPRHDRAVDLTQQAFAKAWRQLPPGDRDRAVGGLLLRVARTVVRDGEGGGNRRPADANRDAQARAADHLADADNAATALAGSGLVELLWTAARTLPSKDVDLLDLHLRHGLDEAESAAAFDIDPAVAPREVGRLRQRFDEAVRSLVLWRGGDPLCIPLETRLRRSRATRFDADTARLVQRHAEGCVWCRRRQTLVVDSFTLFAGIPRVPPGPEDRATVAAALIRAGVPLQGSVHAAGGRRLSLGDTLRYGDGSLFTRARTRPDPAVTDHGGAAVAESAGGAGAAVVAAAVAAGGVVDAAEPQGRAEETAVAVADPPPPPPPPLPPDNPSRVTAELSAAVAALSRRRTRGKRPEVETPVVSAGEPVQQPEPVEAAVGSAVGSDDVELLVAPEDGAADELRPDPVTVTEAEADEPPVEFADEPVALAPTDVADVLGAAEVPADLDTITAGAAAPGDADVLDAPEVPADLATITAAAAVAGDADADAAAVSTILAAADAVAPADAVAFDDADTDDPSLALAPAGDVVAAPISVDAAAPGSSGPTSDAGPDDIDVVASTIAAAAKVLAGRDDAPSADALSGSTVAEVPVRTADVDGSPVVVSPAAAVEAPRSPDGHDTAVLAALPVPPTPVGQSAPVPGPGAEPAPGGPASHRRPVTPPPPLPVAPRPIDDQHRDTRFVIMVAGAAAAILLVVGVLAIRSRGDGAELRASGGGASEQGGVMGGSGLSRSGDGAAGVPDGGGGVRFGGSESTVVPVGPPVTGPGGVPVGPGAFPGNPGAVIGLAPSGGNGTVTGGGTGEVAGGPGPQGSPVTRLGDPPTTGRPGSSPTPTTGSTAPPPKPVIDFFAIEPATAPRNYAQGVRAPFARWSVTIPAGIPDREQYRVEVSGPGVQSSALSASGVWVCPAPVGAKQCSPAKGSYPYVLKLIGPGNVQIDIRTATLTVG
jgi:DNA-directed RNA polymerase specialized sigma24 family protein